MAAYQSLPQAVGRPLLVVLVLAAVTWLAIVDLRVPDVLLTEEHQGFSMDRARRHVENMATGPHPTGSERNRQVRDYLLNALAAAGYSPELQTATRIGDGNGASYLENIIGVKKGQASTGTVLVVGHYDSVHRGPGASDNLAAVAAMLETARLIQDKSVGNEVVFLFTDGEEIGLQGARAFMENHPLARDVRLVFNFEARGVSGPSLMFETGGSTGALIRVLARSTDFPIAYSWSYDVYSRMRNDTDFSVFKDAGIQGLNFAFIGQGFTHYHRFLDTAANLDPLSLAHHGNYMFGLVAAFAKADLGKLAEENHVYFRLPGILVHYPYSLILPIAAGAAVVFLLVCRLGCIRKQLYWPRVLAGMLALPLMLVTASGLVFCLWQVIRRIHSGYYAVFENSGYSAVWYTWAFSLLAVLTSLLLLRAFARRIGAANLFAGILSLWCGGAVFAAFYLPGASYMLVWPLLSGSGALLLLIGSARSSDLHPAGLLAQLALALPVILLTAPGIALLFEAMGLNLAFATAIVLIVLVMSMMVPLAEVMRGVAGSWLSAILTALVIAALAAGSWFSRFDREHPQTVSLRYHLNQDLGKGFLVVPQGLDVGAWLPMAFTPVLKEERLSAFLSARYQKADGPLVEGQAARITLVEDPTPAGQDGRTLTFRLDRDPTNWGLTIRITRNPVTAAWLNGKALEVRDSKLKLRCWSLPPQGYLLKVETEDTEPLVIESLAWRGLETGEIPGLPERPVSMVPHGDMFTVEKTYTFER